MFLGVAAFKREQKILQIRHRVRLEIAEKNGVVFVLKRVRKTQSVQPYLHCLLIFIFVATDQVLIPVIVRCTLPIHCFKVILVVTDIKAASLPLMGSVLLILFDWVNQGLHADCISAVIFLHVVNIEPDGVTLCYVAHAEKVPLRVVECVVVEVKIQVVLAFLYPFNFSQVARLELCVEKYCFFVNILDVEGLWWILQSVWLKLGGHSPTLDRFADELYNVLL